jgi:hypothetical protein
MKFLHTRLNVADDNSFLKTVAEVLDQGSNIDLAIAYWGKGAIKKLDLKSTKPTRIICDLESGGCNPKEIALFHKPPFRNNKDFKVHYLKDLHAKVYWTPISAIVGSANASANGLGEEGSVGSLEAAIQTDDEEILKETAAWFEELWSKSRPVDAAALKRAYEAWRRKQSPPPPNATVLQTLARDPDWFRDKVGVIYYTQDASPAAKAKFERVKRKYYSPNQLATLRKDNLPLYDWALKAARSLAIGDMFLDLADGKIYEFVEAVPYSTTNCIVLLKPIKTVLGLRFPTLERKLLKEAVMQQLKDDEDFESNLEQLPESIRQHIANGLPSISAPASNPR